MAASRTLVLAVAGALLALLSAAVLVPGPLEAPGGVSDPDLVEPVPGGGAVWPYTSRSPGYAGRTLPLNVFVRGEHDAVRRGFRRRADADWRVRRPAADPGREPALAIDDGEVVWLPAHGATRYTRFSTGGWVAQDYQLYAGAYLGVRRHLRAFEAPGGNWTAMQGHVEYWDWFRLRHTVTSTADARAAVDDQFADDPRVARVERVRLGNPGRRDGEGLATVVEFAALAAAVVALRGGQVADRLLPERPRRVAGLAVAVLGVYLGVRAGGVLLESWLGLLHPKVIAGGLYPVLAAGLPAVAYAGARGVRPVAASLSAAAGLAAGLGVEYVALGLSVLPPALVLHRAALVLAIGLIAAGAGSAGEGDGRPGPLGIGVGGWTLALCLALFGLV